jgi:hypothetical protein
LGKGQEDDRSVWRIINERCVDIGRWNVEANKKESRRKGSM